MRTSTVSRSLLSLLALVLALMAGLSLPSAPPASADGGSLTFTPGNGRDITPVRVYTSAPCPAETAYMVVLAFGHGFGAGGQVAVTTNQINFSTAYPFSVPLQDTMQGLAANVGATLEGTYRFELRCTDQYENAVYRVFSGRMSFSDAKHWSASVPAQAQLTRTTAPGAGNADAGNFGTSPHDAPLVEHPELPPNPQATGQAPKGHQSATPGGRGTGQQAAPVDPLTRAVRVAAPHHRSWVIWLAPLGLALALLAVGTRALRKAPPTDTAAPEGVSTGVDS